MNAPPAVGDGVVVGPDIEMLGNMAAAKLVAEARKFDPTFCPPEQRDRDGAARLCRQAVAAYRSSERTN